MIFSKDTRQILKITKGVRRFKKHLKSHHFVKIWECFYGNTQNSYNFKSFADFDSSFNENIEIPKNIVNKLMENIEIDIYLKTLLAIYLFYIKKYEDVIFIKLMLFSL